VKPIISLLLQSREHHLKFRSLKSKEKTFLLNPNLSEKSRRFKNNLNHAEICLSLHHQKEALLHLPEDDLLAINHTPDKLVSHSLENY